MKHPERPDPDALLARVQEQEAADAPGRGRLKIFFGAAAGVGKTYAMLDAGHARRLEGRDVIVGWVDTHGRAETEALLPGLEVLPRRAISYRGTTLQEFDLDAALLRHPELILVDELAHSNAPGSRHPKRWLDVEELLDAGIDVYTTVNVQHLESLNDVIAQITGVAVRETVPDSILDRADEVELVDLPADELLQRLKDGKVYLPPQAERAVESFFRKGNLIALRELALRRTAERVDAQMQDYRRHHDIAEVWPAAERILVCVSPSPLAERVVRAARRMAAGLHAEWIVVYVERPSGAVLSEADQASISATLHHAEQLGAEVVTLSGHSVGEEILTYAQSRNVTRIIVGKPVHSRWRDLVTGSVLDDVIRGSGVIDVLVISGDPEAPVATHAPALVRTSPWAAYGRSVLVVLLCTAVAWLMYPYVAESNLVMTYLLGVVYVAVRAGRGPAILASILSVAAFDYFFVAPHLTFAVSDTQYLITFGVMLLVALVISTLTVRLRRQAEAARERERRTAALYTMSRQLASTRGVENLLAAACRNVGEVFRSEVVALLPDVDGRLVALETGADAGQPRPPWVEPAVAQWAFDHGQLAGRDTETLPGSTALYVPLSAAQGTVGVLSLRPMADAAPLTPESLHLLETFANQIALAVERAHLADEAQRTRVQMETERLRSTLLSSVSHDLRSPLAAITGAASTLLDADSETAITPETRRELLQAVYDEADRLNRLVGNLLDMTRLESGAVAVHKEWQPLEEVIGGALGRLDQALAERPVQVQLPADLPLVPLDAVLIEQLLINLLDNATKYAPAGTPIDIWASVAGSEVVVTVADRGPGLPPGDEERVFDKFYRSQGAGAPEGAGLGLAICRAIIEAHGGRIRAEARPGGGALLRFTLPLGGQPPSVVPELDPTATGEGGLDA